MFFTLHTMMPMYHINHTTLGGYKEVISAITLINPDVITLDVGTITVEANDTKSTLDILVIFRVETWDDVINLMRIVLSRDFQGELSFYCESSQLPAATTVPSSLHYMNIEPPTLPPSFLALVAPNKTNATSSGARHKYCSNMMALFFIMGISGQLPL